LAGLDEALKRRSSTAMTTTVEGKGRKPTQGKIGLEWGGPPSDFAEQGLKPRFSLGGAGRGAEAPLFRGDEPHFKED
jgi:hypothetical protein